MQAINRIQYATINANAGIQGALVFDSANAHRAYHSFKPCGTNPVSKCPGKGPMSSMSQTRMRSLGRMRLELKELGRLTSSPAGSIWQLDRRRTQTRVTTRATVVVSRQTRD